MDWPAQCAVVIPCLNEAETVGGLVRRVRRQLPSVIVVDDGSIDATGKLAEAAGAAVVRHETTRGKGAALASGWQRARARGFLWALHMDGDGQHSPADIPAILSRARQGEAALVVGDRMSAPSGMPWLRRQVNRAMSRWLSHLAGWDWPDTQCGFRLVNLEALSRLMLRSHHFTVESEMMLAFAAAGERIDFVPIRAIYEDERSKIRPLRDTWRWFRWLARYRPGAPGGARARRCGT